MDIIAGMLFTLTLVTALGCGLMAGLFFAFSVSVMKALGHLRSAEGIAAMQSINVPRNDALASVVPDDSGSAGLWSDYLVKWTAWNHVRVVAALGAAAALTVGLCY